MELPPCSGVVGVAGVDDDSKREGLSGSEERETIYGREKQSFGVFFFFFLF